MGYYVAHDGRPTFYFAVPIVALAERPSVVSTTNERLKKQARILAVDDEPTNLMIVGKFLEKLGFLYDLARDSKEAEAYLRKNTYDLMLIDYQLADCTGLEVVEGLKLKKICMPTSGFLVCSAHTTEYLKTECCENSECRGFVTKPFTIAKLQKELENALSCVRKEPPR